MAAVRPTSPESDAALEASSQLYREIADSIPLMVWTASPEAGVDYVNQRVVDYTGVDAGQLAGWGWKAVIHPEDWDRCLATWTAALRAGERSDNEMRLRRADGKYRWHHGTGIPLRDTEGRLVRWFGTCTDIEDQVRSTQALEALIADRNRALNESEQRFRSFMSYVPVTAWIKDSRLRYAYVSRNYEKEIGRHGADVVGRDDLELWTAEAAQIFRRSDEEVLARQAPVQTVEVVPDAAGRKQHWLVVKFPLPDATGAMGVAGMSIDITERVVAEEKLQAYSQRVRQLLGQLVTAQESERRRLADDLHDLIGQNLTALGIELGALKAVLSENSRAAASPRLEAMAGLVNDTIEAIRGVMTELRPPALEKFGLVPALRSYAAIFCERTGMKVNLNVLGQNARLRRDTELALFRIAQEALTNAAKHSGGTSVEITVTEFSGGIRLSVADDGRGFSDPVGARGARRGGWGLPAMRERAEAHGGALRVEFPGRGTRLVVEIPRGDGD